MMVAGTLGFVSDGRTPLHGDLRPDLRGRGRPDDRRVRPLGPPRGRLLGAGGPQLDRRHRDRRLADAADRARGQPGGDRVRLDLGGDRQHPRCPVRLRLRRDLLRSRDGCCTARSASSSPRSRSTAPARIGKPSSAWARHRYGERRPEKQAKAVVALLPRPPHRALQGSLPRHRRRQAERGPGGGRRRGRRRDPRGGGRSPRTRRTARPRQPTRLTGTRRRATEERAQPARRARRFADLAIWPQSCIEHQRRLPRLVASRKNQPQPWPAQRPIRSAAGLERSSEAATATT